MRDLHMLDAYRLHEKELQFAGFPGDGSNGIFELPSPVDGVPLHIIVGTGMGWEHVSVSRHDRCPVWEEMDYLARMFWQAHETVVQFHVPRSDHVNVHDRCLHLWRPTRKPVPRPPAMMVG